MWLPTFMCQMQTFNSEVVRTTAVRAPLFRTVADMVNNSRNETTVERFYAASGPMATSVFECDARYYRECLMADRGAVTVWLSSGEVEHVAGTWYLDVERVRGDEIDGAIEVIYVGVTLRKYPAGTWTGWETVDTAEV